MHKLNWLLVLALVFLVSCSQETSQEPEIITYEPVLPGWSLEESPLNGLNIEDNMLLYDRDPLGIDYLYITILPTYDKKGNLVRFSDINSVRDYNIDVEELKIYFQEGDEEGPYKDSLTFDALESNGTITIRGHSTRLAPQKSYKVRLGDNVELWYGQSVLNLNKHPFDATRVLNALSFNLLQDIPHITSMQTQFVRVFIRDLSSASDGAFVDYGHYTHVEQANKKFLQAHNLDRSGSLYKIEYYEFHLDDRLKLKSDPTYDKDAFEDIIEIKEGANHEKLLKMIHDVNDLNINIHDVFDEHFNEDNYLTWLAYNILVGNYDTQTQNYFIYSPSNAKTWYFLPWDYDGAFGEDLISGLIKREEFVGKRLHGIANYWNTTISNRYFKYPENVEKLNNKIEEVYAYLTPEIIKEKMDNYSDYYLLATQQMPDLKYYTYDAQEARDQYNTTHLVPKMNRDLYYESLEAPMPIFMNVPTYDANGKLVLGWSPSYDLQGDLISYTVEISATPDFTDLVYSQVGVLTTRLELDMYLRGTYYLRVTIQDDKGHYQNGFDVYMSEDKVLYQGVKSFNLNGQ